MFFQMPPILKSERYHRTANNWQGRTKQNRTEQNKEKNKRFESQSHSESINILLAFGLEI